MLLAGQFKNCIVDIEPLHDIVLTITETIFFNTVLSDT